jgi:hypothetical protein
MALVYFLYFDTSPAPHPPVTVILCTVLFYIFRESEDPEDLGQEREQDEKEWEQFKVGW